jgi:hypothetical protein
MKTYILLGLIVYGPLFLIFFYYGYLKPQHIKSNMKYTNITTTFVNYVTQEDYLVVNKALINKTDITFLLSNYTCIYPCPKNLTIECWNYKNHYGEVYFDRFSYIIWIIGYLLYVAILYLPPIKKKFENTTTEINVL